MYRRKLTSLTGALAALLILLFADHPQATAAPATTDAAIDAAFQNWSKADSPGCTLGYKAAAGPEQIRSYGSADLEHNIPNSADTVFEAGSVSKQFTAAAVLTLVDRGQLALSDDIRKYIPEMPDYGSRITVDELLNHTSGLRDWGDIEAMAGWPRSTRIYTLADVLDIASRQRSLNYPAGTAWSYTNTGYNLLAIIVERVSHRTLAEFSHDSFFVTLGMNHTQWRDDFRRVVKSRAIAYESGTSGYKQLMPFEDAYGNGGLLTTVHDLLRWNDALTTGELGPFVTTELQREAVRSDGRPTHYARGLFIAPYRGFQEIAHSGSTAGYRAWLGRYPDAHVSIALLCNAGDANPVKLAHEVANVFLPEQVPPNGVTLTPDQLGARSGIYAPLTHRLPMILEVQGQTLRETGGPVLTAISPREFKAGASTFTFDDGDRLLVTDGAGGQFQYRRAQPWRPQLSELRPITGVYESDEAMATYEISIEDGHLRATPTERRGISMTLSPIFTDTFALLNEGDKVVLHLTRDPRGSVTGFELTSARVYALPFHRRGSDRAASTDKPRA